ncbi:MAG: DUF2185 domain-containing protein [Candidatus Melainabacteria bacterium]|nr:MAG: DUF2185 domain-containing protein [Candidatus Melainabacteria bacterium]
MSYVLENIETIYRPNYRTMTIPRLEQRLNLVQGEAVRVGFLPAPASGAEATRIWVRVELVRGDGRYIGVLLETPPGIANLNEGFRVEFSADNVSEVFIDEGDYRWFDDQKYAMVSSHMFEENSWPGRVMRIPPAEEIYSGWLILKGDEDRHFMRDFSNFHAFQLFDCVDKCPPLKTVLYQPIGADYTWDSENFEYRLTGK